MGNSTSEYRPAPPTLTKGVNNYNPYAWEEHEDKVEGGGEFYKHVVDQCKDFDIGADEKIRF